MTTYSCNFARQFKEWLFLSKALSVIKVIFKCFCLEYFFEWVICNVLALDWEVNCLVPCKELQKWIRFWEVFVFSVIAHFYWDAIADNEQKTFVLKKRKALFVFSMFFPSVQYRVYLSDFLPVFSFISVFQLFSLFWLFAHVAKQLLI